MHRALDRHGEGIKPVPARHGLPDELVHALNVLGDQRLVWRPQPTTCCPQEENCKCNVIVG